MSLFGPDDTAALLYGLAKCKNDDSELINGICAHIRHKVNVITFQVDDLSRMLFSLGVLGARGEHVDHVSNEILDHVADFSLLGELNDYNLVMCILGASKLTSGTTRFWSKAIKEMCNSDRLSRLSFSQITSLQTSLANMSDTLATNDINAVMDATTQSILQYQKMRDATIENIASLLVACAKVKYNEDDLLSAVGACVHAMLNEQEFKKWINPALLISMVQALGSLSALRNPATKILLRELIANPLRL